MNKLLVVISLLLTGLSFGQYGNEWIDYSQKYYSFKIQQDGVYRLDYATLSSAGLPLATISPDDFQVFGFEEEQQIWVEDGDDGSFDPGDYILLYARKNNTWLDSALYEDPNQVANKYFPHYNDTINYYLSWNTGSNARIQEETDVSFGAYSSQNYFWKTNFEEGHEVYLEGFKIGGMSHATYVDGEGWFGNFVFAASPTNYQDDYISTTNAYTGAGAPAATGVAVSAGASNASYDGAGNHHTLLQYGLSNITVHDTIYGGYPKITLPFSIPASSLGASTTRVRHQLVDDLGVASDYQAVSYVEITYPHNVNLGGTSYFEMELPFNSSEAKSRFDFVNFASSSPMAFTLDGNMKRIPVVNTAGVYQVLVPNLSSGENQDFVIFDETAIVDVNELNPINGTGDFVDYSTYDFESAYLILTHSKLWSSATAYRNYRSSLTGGGHNAVMIDVEELYHQFGGGVQKHIMGLRRFVHYAYNESTEKPTHLFLLGKAVREANESIASGNGIRLGALSYETCLVPTFGYPASDNLITAQLEGNLWDPLIPTGRLAANSNAEVEVYLGKVQEYEMAQDPNSFYSVEDKLWQKEILHFGGGSNAVEQSTFKFYLENYEEMLEGPYFGGNVTAYYKTVSDPIDPVTLFDVTDDINEGVSLMTFFGHASADGFDQNVDDPENWNNKGKYPVVVGNACLTGNIHEPNNLSTSETYVLLEDKGAIAFLANVKQAFSNSLNSYSEALFYDASTENYGATLGEHSRNAIQDVQSPDMSFGLQNVCLQMTLHGDPAIRFNSHLDTELEVNESSLFIEPAVVDLTVDSIDVNVVIYNLGQSTTDTFAVELTRTFPNNNGDSLYTQLVYGIDYIDTVVFSIPFYTNIAVGINEFSVSVDLPSLVTEHFDEVGNNQISKQVLFDVDGIYPAWPYDYAVVPNDTITISGSTVNPFADLATYRFEIDTTDLFNSPEHRFNVQASLGGVVQVEYDEWFNAGTGSPDPLLLEDSVAYFWRVALEDGGDYYWIENSFQHINDKQGWGQDHFFQFKNNDFLFLDYDRPSRRRLFGPSYKTIDADVYGAADSFLEFAFTLYHIDGEIAEYNFCGITPQIFVCVIDPFSLEPWGTYYNDGSTIHNPTHNFGNANNDGACRPRVEYHFGFSQKDATQLAACENMIENEIPDGHYYLIYTSIYALYQDWEDLHPDLFDTFADLGSDSIYVDQDTLPFILFGKKGDPSFFQEVHGSYIDELIHLEDTLWGFDYYGEEVSTKIGPAKEWDAIYWKQDAMELPTEDSTRLKVFGISATGNEVLMIDTLFTENDSIINLNSYIDAAEYPFLELKAELIDTAGSTPAQIDYWHVLYQHVPEAALDGSEGVYLPTTDSLAEGQDIVVAFDVKNISDLPMDSLLINYWIEDADHNIIPIDYPRQDSLRVGEIIRDTLTIPTFGLEGLNSLWVEVNPYVAPGTQDQLEQHYFNNIGQIPFYAAGDNENPILDVTFNGYHIMNGDIVDPFAEVVISLKDENLFLLLDEEADTANFGIYLTSPDGIQRRMNFRNSLGQPLMTWIPANDGDNKFKIIFDGDFQMDGTYRLLVQGTDESGNISGDFDYDIEFEVDHHSSITNLMNYPNPFSTQTQFVFTLTGSVIPDEFTIQILTVSGKVVREITVDELGPIQIGRNITEFRWDGRDEYGDLLANGVYLYHVITKINGEDVDHRESGADEYFVKEFGKMYILR
jgi:hypothetical protein